MAMPTPMPASAPVDSPLLPALAFEVGLEVCVPLCNVDVAAEVVRASNLDIEAAGKTGAEAGVNSERSLEAHWTSICGKTATKNPVVTGWVPDAFANRNDP
jgi:hypothetical protein